MAKRNFVRERVFEKCFNIKWWKSICLYRKRPLEPSTRNSWTNHSSKQGQSFGNVPWTRKYYTVRGLLMQWQAINNLAVCEVYLGHLSKVCPFKGNVKRRVFHSKLLCSGHWITVQHDDTKPHFCWNLRDRNTQHLYALWAAVWSGNRKEDWNHETSSSLGGRFFSGRMY